MHKCVISAFFFLHECDVAITRYDTVLLIVSYHVQLKSFFNLLEDCLVKTVILHISEVNEIFADIFHSPASLESRIFLLVRNCNYALLGLSSTFNYLNFLFSKWVLQTLQCSTRFTNQEIKLAKEDLDEAKDEWEDSPKVCISLAHQLAEHAHCVSQIDCLHLKLGESALEVARYPEWLQFLSQTSVLLLLLLVNIVSVSLA